jgi:hypothetical protein
MICQSKIEIILIDLRFDFITIFICLEGN